VWVVISRQTIVPQNPDGSHSERRDLQEPHINAGDSEEKENVVGMKENLQVTDLRSATDKNLCRNGKEAIVGESIQEDFRGFNFSAKKFINEDFQLGSGCSEPYIGAKKGDPRKSGEVYVGQRSQIKEKMEWNLVEGGRDGVGVKGGKGVGGGVNWGRKL
jgi:hypothetical protein